MQGHQALQQGDKSLVLWLTNLEANRTYRVQRSTDLFDWADFNAFTANSASNLSTTLGQDFSINSLTFTGSGTSAGSPTSVTIGGSNTLTINATNANGNTAGNGITAGTYDQVNVGGSGVFSSLRRSVERPAIPAKYHGWDGRRDSLHRQVLLRKRPILTFGMSQHGFMIAECSSPCACKRCKRRSSRS